MDTSPLPMDAGTDQFHKSQTRRLIPIFCIWKAALLLLAALCPGPGYDTSAHILFSNGGDRDKQFASLSLPERLTLNLFRWDALYIVKAAQRDYIYEQEWAFSWAYSALLGTYKQYLFGSRGNSVKSYIWAGVIISNVCHFFSVLVLYRLVRHLIGSQRASRVPFVASMLHIMSPAGLFLSAPYTEALFSALNFTGMLHYVLARQTAKASRSWTVTQDSYMLSSGFLFAAGSLIRSNGLLSGLILLYDVASFLPRAVALQLSAHDIRRIFVTCVAGVFVAVGYIIPQYLAYNEYCGSTETNEETRPWCNYWIPSIYSWVQSHYWNVGFLRYWNLSNIPLFLLAAPMLWLLSSSSVAVLRGLSYPLTTEINARKNQGSAPDKATELRLFDFPHLALPQLVLAVTAATNFHVQIINRISSGYPIWYLVVASWINNREGVDEKGMKATYSEWTVRLMVVYSIVQGMLFAAFLPPA